MKFFRLILALVLSFSGVVVAATPASAAEISAIGGRVSWDASTFYAPTSCSSFNFDYVNGTGIRLLEFSMEIKSRFGDKLADQSVIGMPAGTSGRWSTQICKSALTDGAGPYIVSLHVEDYNGSVRTAESQLTFLSRGGTSTAPSQPAPPQNSSPAVTSVEVIGGRVSWDASAFYEPTGCSSFNFDYVNGTGIRLLEFSMELKSRFGDKLADQSVIGMPAGTSGRWSTQICKSALTDGRGPYTVTLHVEDYNGSVRTADAQLTFLSRTSTVTAPTVKPAPVATPIAKPIGAAPVGGIETLRPSGLKIKLAAKKATVVWSPLVDQDGFETDFEVRITGKNSSKFGAWRTTGYATSFTFAKLTKGATYKVEVRPVNDSGFGLSKALSFRSR